MARGPKRHMKRVAAPSHWMMGKLNGVFAPRPSAGPHKLRECLPLIVLLRNRLKYALTYRESKAICIQKLIKVDGKARTDIGYPAGFMDVVTIDKTKENFRLLYDTKGRFVLNRISNDEAAYKLCRVKSVGKGSKGVSNIVTHDGRTVRFPDPEIKAKDTIRLDIASGRILDFVKFEQGKVAMIMGGNNVGRVGIIGHIEKVPGKHEIIHLKDKEGHGFCTLSENVMVIGSDKPWISLAKGEGIKLSNMDDREKRMSKTQAA